jgi:hypothetical protein
VIPKITSTKLSLFPFYLYLGFSSKVSKYLSKILKATNINCGGNPLSHDKDKTLPWPPIDLSMF